MPSDEIAQIIVADSTFKNLLVSVNLEEQAVCSEEADTDV
jgi:hypothetical protein